MPMRASRSRERHRGSVPCDAAERDERHERQHHGLEREVHAVQHAERRAGVVDAREVQEAGDDHDAVVQRQRAAAPAPW